LSALWSVFPITSFSDHNLLFPCGPFSQLLHFQTTTCFFPVVRFSNHFIYGPQLAFSLWSGFPITSFSDHNLLFLCGPVFQLLHFQTTTCFSPVVRFSNYFFFGPQLAFSLWSVFPITSFPDHNLLFPCGPVFQLLHFQTTTCFFPVVRFSNYFISGPLLIQNLWSEIKETRKSDHASTFQASNSARIMCIAGKIKKEA